MSSDLPPGNQFNPYQSSPTSFESQPPINMAKIQAPAVALIIVGVFGLLASIYSIVNALYGAPPQVDPNAPEWLGEVMKNTQGPVAAGIQAVFVFVGLFILFGGIQMLRTKTWGLSLAAAIVSMVNFGSCCCVIGLPIGVWALVILLQADVKNAFARQAGF